MKCDKVVIMILRVVITIIILEVGIVETTALTRMEK